MKRRYVVKFVALLLALITLLQLVGCKRTYRREYYGDVNNFITEEAVVDNIIYNREKGYIVFWLSEIDEAYVTRSFKIEGNNADLVLENGILDEIKIGDTITYTSAPRVFWNGYFFPIIQIATSDEEILNLEDGYENLMDMF